MVDVSVCICTFRRPDGLSRLLRSLRDMPATSPRFEIIVVDNDAARSGESATDFMREIQAEGFTISVIDDDSGDVSPVEITQATQLEARNLLLVRQS